MKRQIFEYYEFRHVTSIINKSSFSNVKAIVSWMFFEFCSDFSFNVTNNERYFSLAFLSV